MSADPVPQEPKPPVANEGGPPYDGEMEKRIEKLESDMAAIKLDLGILKATSATKADLAEAKTSVINWVTAAIFLAQLLPALLKLLLNT